jgi:hypothetical protein
MDSSVAEGVHSPEAAAARNWWTQEQFRLIAGKWPIQLKHCATVGLCIFWHWHLEYSFIYGAYVWFNKVKRWHRRIYRIYLHNPTKLFDIFEKTTIPIELSSPSPLRKVAPPNKLTVTAAPIVGSQKKYIYSYIYIIPIPNTNSNEIAQLMYIIQCQWKQTIITSAQSTASDWFWFLRNINTEILIVLMQGSDLTATKVRKKN